MSDLSDKQKAVKESILNDKKWSGADDKAILRKAFHMLADMGYEIIPPDTNSDKFRFIEGLSEADKNWVKSYILVVEKRIELPYLVDTPKPYVICLSHFRNDIERKERILELVNSVDKLRNTMALLGIDNEKGLEMSLTLNMRTTERLMDIAYGKHATAYNAKDIESTKLFYDIYKELKEKNKSKLFEG